MDSTPVNVLWTSGWDSTFRVAYLLLVEGRTVQPWYVQDVSRRSTKVELKTQQTIRRALEDLDSTVSCRLLTLKTELITDIPADPDITRKYNALYKRSFLGGQYDWLSRFAKWQGIELELSIHRDDTAHAFLENDVEALPDGTYRLRKNSDANLEIFAPFIFPLFNLSKPDMQQHAEQMGFGHIMEMTWFCFNPLLDGTPCGQCNPCKYTTDEGLGRRVPAPTQSRKIEALILRRAWSLRNRTTQFRRIISG